MSMLTCQSCGREEAETLISLARWQRTDAERWICPVCDGGGTPEPDPAPAEHGGRLRSLLSRR